jgi:hypothetical protein
VTNILKKLTRDVVDATWTTWNQARDTVFIDTHRASIQMQLDKLSGKSSGLWDRFVRWILSFVPTFSELEHFELLLSGVPGFENIKIPKEQLL